LTLLYAAGARRIWLSKHNGKAYASTRIGNKGVFVHRVLMRALGRRVGKKDIDHKNGNSLDNRVFNLRIATRAQNLANQPRPRNNTSGFKGACLVKSTGRWLAYVGTRERRIYLGCHDTAREAGMAYNRAAKKMYGKFAKLNACN
jgi:hypothetical protein